MLSKQLFRVPSTFNILRLAVEFPFHNFLSSKINWIFYNPYLRFAIALFNYRLFDLWPFYRLIEFDMIFRHEQETSMSCSFFFTHRRRVDVLLLTFQWALTKYNQYRKNSFDSGKGCAQHLNHISASCYLQWKASFSQWKLLYNFHLTSI